MYNFTNDLRDFSCTFDRIYTYINYIYCIMVLTYYTHLSEYINIYIYRYSYIHKLRMSLTIFLSFSVFLLCNYTSLYGIARHGERTNYYCCCCCIYIRVCNNIIMCPTKTLTARCKLCRLVTRGR